MIIDNKEYSGVDFTKDSLLVGDYEYCVFKNCVFSGTNLSNIIFSECTFESCDLSLVKTDNTAFKDVFFKGCKLLGVHFEDCNKFLFEVGFSSCQLDLSCFYQCVMKKTKFDNCSLKEVDFTETDLTSSSFQKSELLGAIFDRTVLEKVDFKVANNYMIDPEENRLKKAKFSKDGLVGLLGKYDIVIN